MNRSTLISLLLFVVLGAVLVGGVVRLFQLRFEAGDIYPAYSSFRTDPKGIRALFESLRDLPGIEVERNLRPIRHLDVEEGTTVVLAGLRQQIVGTPVEDIERLLESGGRVLISYFPFSDEEEEAFRRLRRRALAELRDDEEAEESPESERLAGLDETFDFELHFKKGPEDRRGLPLEGVAAGDGDGLTGDVPTFWFSRVYLDLGEEWEPLLWVGEYPVVAQREYRGGTLVVMTDSYWLSNEAMRLTRRTGFVASLLGSPRKIIFNETHLGVRDPQRLSHLMRRMDLEFPLGILVLFAILFIWKNSSAFPPRVEEALLRESDVKGYDSQAGLVNLLRANFSRKQLLRLCWDEWYKTVDSAERKRLAGRIEAAEILAKVESETVRSERDLVGRYREVTSILNERK